MSKFEYDEADEENLVDIDEYDLPSSRKISHSIHDFSEIMSGANSIAPSDRFSGAYNPKRKTFLGETYKDNIIKENK
jgi:hypothetical protein